MSNIFISYSRRDAAAARRLCAALTARSRDVWIDWEDIPPTAAWWAEITAAIEAADAVLFLVSPDSAASKVCGEELAVAHGLAKRLLPVLVRDVDAARVPQAAAELNWVLAREADPFEAAVEALLVAIDTDLDWVRDHTRLLVRAGDWQRHGEDSSYLLRGADLEAAHRWQARAAGKKPPTAPLHARFIEASAAAEAVEIERLQGLYRSALARQLAAQAALISHETDAQLDRAMLLAVESMRRVPGTEADRVLRDGLGLRALRVATWRQQGSPRQMAVSSCGRWIACGGEEDPAIVVRSAADGREVRRVPVDGESDAMAFMPGGDALVALGGSTLTRLDLATGALRRIGEHPGLARGLCALPDGAAVVSVGPGGALCHAADGGGERWRLALEAEAWVAAAAPSGALLAVGASDCVIRVVEAGTGRVRHELAHHGERPVALLERGASDAGIAALAFGGDPLRLASAGLDGTVRVWDPATGEQLLSGSHGRDVLCVALQGERRLVASGGLDRQLRIWPADGGAPVAAIAHQGPVTAVDWSDDGRWLLSACGDGCVRLWQVGEDGRPVETAREVTTDWVGSARFAGDHQVAAADDGSVTLSGIAAPIDRGVDHGYALKDAACDADAQRLAVRIDGHELIIYDVAAGWRWRLLDQPDFGDSMWFTADGALITTCWDGGVREYDAATLELRCLQAHPGRVWKARASHDGRLIATAVQDEPCLRVWARGAEAPALALPHGRHVRAITFSPDDGLVASGCDDGSVQVWNRADGRMRWQHRHEGIVWSVAFDATGRRIASVADDAALVLRDALDGAELQRVAQPATPDEVAFSPCGRWLAMRFSYLGPHLIVVWELPQMRLHAEFDHDDQVAAMSWNDDGTLLASGCNGGMVRVFDVAARCERVRLPFERWCGCVKFVPATRELLTASHDGKLRLSCVDPLHLVQWAQARVPRGLTDAEWRQYLPDEPRPG